jgi:putative transposase
MIKTIVEDAYQLDISKIVLGRLKNIRTKSRNNNKVNGMINNFWSFNYIARRFREKAKEYGIEVDEKSEYKMSSKCPLCRSENVMGEEGSLNASLVDWRRVGRLWAY